MSNSPPPDEIEEGSPMGGDECHDSPVHMVEPQIDLSEMEPQVELDEDIDHNLVEPQVELDEGAEHTEGSVYPYANLAVEYYDNDPASANYTATGVPYSGDSTMNGMYDSEDTLNDSSQLNNDLSMDAKNDDGYNEMMQRSYFEDYIGSSASTGAEDSNTYEGTPISRFPTIVKALESAEYETLQILYQLLFQRSAWDTQEILSKRILEFSGFSFNKTSEEYCNREMMLQSLPSATLFKIASILCLEQIRNINNMSRRELIEAILRFLSSPSIKNRLARPFERGDESESCGCRNKCLMKFTDEEKDFLYEYHLKFRNPKKQDLYYMNLITVTKSAKLDNVNCKKQKLREHKYSYQVRLGDKVVNVCKGGFMLVFGLKMSRLNKIQNALKRTKADNRDLSIEYPPAPNSAKPAPVEVPVANPVTNPVENLVENLVKSPAKTPAKTPAKIPTKPPTKPPVKIKTPVDTPVGTPKSNMGEESFGDSSNSSSSKLEVINKEDVLSVDEETKESISQKVTAVFVEKIDPTQIPAGGASSDSSENKSEKMKLKDFPLVVKSMEDVSDELLIDLHFLLYLNSDQPSKLKKNILEFEGFSFDKDSEDFDERKEFLQRMSCKMLTDVSRSFSLAVLNKKEDTILNILSFLMKPDDSYLRTAASVPVLLSDVEFDDIDGFSDSDESITCEVVEKKVECIELLSSGEDSDKETNEAPVEVKVEKEDPDPTYVPPAPTTPPGPKKPRSLKDFETIRKIVNTHPPEYLLDIYELLFLEKHDANDADALRSKILGFQGFEFEKGTQDYVKRKQVLDRMLYNNVRRVYNTLIHNSTEVKVFSKPTMINEIFQFLFKLPDTDTSVRPLPPGAKTLMPKPVTSTPAPKTVTTTTAPPTSSQEFFIASILPSQTGKLSDLKRVFQRVACFPCEYLVDVHKLLFMSDCDTKVIRQNIFGFKGFGFGVDSPEFQQRKMYLEYLTFHSLRKISSVLTTRSVDLRNSTKHELASHLTEVLAEYCNTSPETLAEAQAQATAATSPATATIAAAAITAASTTTASTTAAQTTAAPVTPVVSTAPVSTGSLSTTSTTVASSSKPANSLGISIVESHSINSAQAIEPPPRSTRKRKRPPEAPEKRLIAPPQPPPTSAASTGDFADINLPEIEQYRKIYGANLNVYPSVAPTFQISTPLAQTFPQFIPQTVVSPFGQPLVSIGQHIGQPIVPPQFGYQPQITVARPVINQVKPPSEVIVPSEVPDKIKEVDKPQEKNDNGYNEESEEDGDKPLASLIGHPSDNVLKKHINDIVQSTDLQDLTMNSVIQKVYAIYPKFDLTYRKEFIKSTLRNILYKLGDDSNSDSKDNQNAVSRDSGSPDCSVTTTNNRDTSLPGSPATAANS